MQQAEEPCVLPIAALVACALQQPTILAQPATAPPRGVLRLQAHCAGMVCRGSPQPFMSTYVHCRRQKSRCSWRVGLWLFQQRQFSRLWHCQSILHAAGPPSGRGYRREARTAPTRATRSARFTDILSQTVTANRYTTRMAPRMHRVAVRNAQDSARDQKNHSKIIRHPKIWRNFRVAQGQTAMGQGQQMQDFGQVVRGIGCVDCASKPRLAQALH